MRLFGFEIRRVRKIDDEYVDSLVKTISILHVELGVFRNLLSDIDLEHFEGKTMGMIFEHLETVKKLTDIYEDNKFARPGQCFSMVYHMAQLEKNTVVFNKLMATFNAGKIDIEQTDGYDDIEDERKQLGGKLLDIWNTCSLLLGKMIAEITMIDICIRGDLMRISTGVDIARDWYTQQRRIKDGKDKIKFEFSYIQNREVSKRRNHNE